MRVPNWLYSLLVGVIGVAAGRLLVWIMVEWPLYISIPILGIPIAIMTVFYLRDSYRRGRPRNNRLTD